MGFGFQAEKGRKKAQKTQKTMTETRRLIKRKLEELQNDGSFERAARTSTAESLQELIKDWPESSYNMGNRARRGRCQVERQREGEAKMQAGTHRRRIAKSQSYGDFLGFDDDGKPLVEVWCDENGVPITFDCNFWQLPKTDRPRCGAKCRDAHQCRAPVVVKEDGSFKKRCRLHGGLSTGPKSAEGRAAIGASNRRRGRTLGAETKSIL
jgi:hypothetical protein